jgi:S-methylmethionine-dependent homocysteine/selenocysteine methylase
MSDLLARLKHETLLLDGAMGTELERRGVDTSGAGWTSKAIIDHSELITQIHAEYIAAGARIITANTFRTNPRTHKSGRHSAEALTKRAIELARDAVKASGRHDVLIAGSIAPANDSLKRNEVAIDDKDLLDEHAEMAKWITDSGADLILIETMNTIREAFIALVAAKRRSDLPVAVSIVAGSRKQLISGASLPESVELLAKAGADVLMLNCQSLSILSPMLGEFGSLCSGLGLRWGVYANASEMINGKWQQVAHEDHEFAAFTREAMDQGAAIVGGCCGTTPITTELMATAIDTMKVSNK